MIVTIHQPNCFPWLGYFDKMRQADVFVLLDTVPFTKGGYQNRIQVKGPQGAQWLTVPVQTSGYLGQSTLNVQVVSNLPWRRNHILTLEMLYRRTACFPDVMPKLKDLYNIETERLVEFAIPGIEWIRNSLNIQTKLVRASELNAEGSSSELLLNIVKCLGGTTYLSGPSGRNYLDLELFENAGVKVDFHSFKPFEYAQLGEPFVGGLSALDYLFNVGHQPWW